MILPTVLEGLAKYAHLINITFFGDLIKVLQRLVAFGGLSLRENLHSVYSVFTVSLPLLAARCYINHNMDNTKIGNLRSYHNMKKYQLWKLQKYGYA